MSSARSQILEVSTGSYPTNRNGSEPRLVVAVCDRRNRAECKASARRSQTAATTLPAIYDMPARSYLINACGGISRTAPFVCGARARRLQIATWRRPALGPSFMRSLIASFSLPCQNLRATAMCHPEPAKRGEGPRNCKNAQPLSQPAALRYQERQCCIGEVPRRPSAARDDKEGWRRRLISKPAFQF